MMAITHAVIAAAGVSLILGTSAPLPLALAVAGSQLPDLDSTRSVLGQICFPLSNWLEDHYPHRTVTHSLLVSAILAVVSMAVGYGLWSNLWALMALPLGHLLACFSDTFTRQGVQLFWPEPIWCISVSNPRRRLVTGGPGEYWVLIIAMVFLVLGCWMAGVGGVTGQMNQSLGLRSGAVATFNTNSHSRQVYAEIVGVWADDQSSANGQYLILGLEGRDFIVTDGTAVYHTGRNMAVERLATVLGEATSRQTQTLIFSEEEPGPQLQQVMSANPGRQIYVSGTLTVDYPEAIQFEGFGRSFETATLAGNTLTLKYHPLDQAISRLAEQWITGQLVVLIP
jgi:inner membrane protein